MLIGLGGGVDVFGQKKTKDLDAPDLKEIPKLIDDLKAKDGGTRARAADRLAAAAARRSKDVKEAIPTFLDMVKSDSSADARKGAAHALGFADADPMTTVPVLLTALESDKDYGVKAAAATSLGYIGNSTKGAAKDAIPALQKAQAEAKAAGKDDKEKAALGKAAGGALKMISGKTK